MSWLADRFPALSKHLGVLRESWRNQNEADAAFRPREEHEFLPAALEIMEKPPSPGMRWLLPFHALDPFFFAAGGKCVMEVQSSLACSCGRSCAASRGVRRVGDPLYYYRGPRVPGCLGRS